ncbi:MAG: MlaC/ttg2D family ABC transporter substrate-binding protein [Candidatus Binatia bacterium]
MQKQKRARHLVALAVVTLFWARPTLGAGSPKEEIQGTVEKVLAVLQNPDFKSGAKKEERRSQLRQIIYPKFDFAEMAKRSLGSQWQNRTPEEQREFTKAFTRLLEDSYLNQIESYNGEKFRYLREKQDKDVAEVETKVVNKKGEEFAINYRLHRVGEAWKVYDVIIENISLVNNYRSQFSRVLTKSSFAELLRIIHQKNLATPAREKK